MNERERAYLALLRVERQRARADFAVEAEMGSEGERGFLATVVRGVLRWRTKLDHLIEALSARSIESIDPEVVVLLRSGLYQLMEMEAPAYAVVNEHVAIAARRMPRAGGFVNAVLRNAARTPLESLLPEGEDVGALAIRTGHPEWVLRRWIARFGRERAERIARANQEPSYPDLLVNTSRIGVEAAGERLAAKGIAAERSPFGLPMFRLRGSTAAVEEELGSGLFHPMDEGSAIVAGLVREGASVLDLAAAPGGKSIVLRLRGHAVTAHDASLTRVRSMRAIWRRLFGEDPRVIVGDASRPAFRTRIDSVLLDAPCSATGTLRKNPEVRHRIDEAALRDARDAQVRMLHGAAAVAECEIVYATCSLEPEENEEVVEEFLADHREFERFDLAPRVPSSLAHAVAGGVLSLTPEMGTDGFTAIGLRRRSPES